MTPYRVRRSKSFLLLMATCLSMHALKAQDSTHLALSAKECVDYAMKNTVQVKNALLAIQIQQQSNKEITSAALPQVSGSVDANYYPKVPVQSFPNFIAAATYGVLEQEGVKNGTGTPIISPKDFGFIQAQFGTKYTGSVGVGLSQLLFDGQVFVGLQAREASIKYATKTAEVTQVQIKANVYKVYYQLVVGKRQIGTVDANIERTEKLLHDTKAFYTNGFAEKLDVDKVEVTLANLRTERVKLDNTLKNGLLGLKLLIGMPIRNELTLTDTLSEAQLKTNILDTSYNYSDRKEYEQAEWLKRLNEYNIKRYQLSKLPTVALLGSFSKNAQRNKFNFFDFNEDWFTTALIGVKVSVPIFEGLAKNARISKARLELQQTENMMDVLKLSIDNEVETARTSLQSAFVSMDFQQKNMVLAENVYNQTKLKYEQGLGSNLEITNANAELRTAQINYYSALYDAIIAKVDFLTATGKL
ncbi:TolC family protein [Paraflavitalea sp. CAU 1676]|uniref:TolC family protein n=1 Tax=Paraflavitalea sp. CAU 1676 TaxID=3032598 RepID=UPI0023DBDA26|nr:TolC family protein [Paraflavitalea sp. CAU 1676]MDF2190739.1 TolC family protein [Paraflavitalea sp. CAU 1676]